MAREREIYIYIARSAHDPPIDPPFQLDMKKKTPLPGSSNGGRAGTRARPAAASYGKCHDKHRAVPARGSRAHVVAERYVTASSPTRGRPHTIALV